MVELHTIYTTIIHTNVIYIFKMLLLSYYRIFNVVLMLFDSNKIVTQYQLLCRWRDSNTVTQYQHSTTLSPTHQINGLSVPSGLNGHKIQIKK